MVKLWWAGSKTGPSRCIQHIWTNGRGCARTHARLLQRSVCTPCSSVVPHAPVGVACAAWQVRCQTGSTVAHVAWHVVVLRCRREARWCVQCGRHGVSKGKQAAQEGWGVGVHALVAACEGHHAMPTALPCFVPAEVLVAFLALAVPFKHTIPFEHPLDKGSGVHVPGPIQKDTLAVHLVVCKAATIRPRVCMALAFASVANVLALRNARHAHTRKRTVRGFSMSCQSTISPVHPLSIAQCTCGRIKVARAHGWLHTHVLESLLVGSHAWFACAAAAAGATVA